MILCGFQRRSLIATYFVVAAIGLLSTLTGAGCGTANNTLNPIVEKTAADFGISVTPSSVTLDVGDFTLTVTPASQGSDTVLQGLTASYIITLTSVNNFVPLVTLTMPVIQGALVTPGTFTLTPTASGATTTLTIVTSNSAQTPLGTYLFTVSGQGGGYNATGKGKLVVFGD